MQLTMNSISLCFNWHSQLKQFKGQSYTVKEFAHRNAENLVAKMNEVNEQHKRVGRVPTVAEVRKMIDQAKELPGVVTY